MVPVLWKASRRPVVNWNGYSSSGISTGPSWSTGVKGARFSTSSARRWACRNLVPTRGFSTTSVVIASPLAFSAPLVLAASCSLGVLSEISSKLPSRQGHWTPPCFSSRSQLIPQNLGARARTSFQTSSAGPKASWSRFASSWVGDRRQGRSVTLSLREPPVVGRLAKWGWRAHPSRRNLRLREGLPCGDLHVVPVGLVGLLVLHRARHVGDELLVVTRPPEQVEAHLHPRGYASGRHDPAGVHHAGAADLARRRDLGEALDRHLAWRRLLDVVRLLAVGGAQAVEEAHLPVHPRSCAHAAQERRLGQRTDELVQAAVVHLLPGAESARDQERVHGGRVRESVVGQDGEPCLGLHGTHRVRYVEGIQLGVVPFGHGEDSVGSGEVHDLRILENVDAQSKAGNALPRSIASVLVYFHPLFLLTP